FYDRQALHRAAAAAAAAATAASGSRIRALKLNDMQKQIYIRITCNSIAKEEAPCQSK
ncbi:hypothetical protein M0802_016402, partial [Mischocyttarus mexicanus]